AIAAATGCQAGKPLRSETHLSSGLLHRAARRRRTYRAHVWRPPCRKDRPVIPRGSEGWSLVIDHHAVSFPGVRGPPGFLLATPRDAAANYENRWALQCSCRRPPPRAEPVLMRNRRMIDFLGIGA